MEPHHFWLTDTQFERLRRFLPNKERGVKRVDDRRVISGIIHVIRNGPRASACRDIPPQ
jgi:transposase